jgi:hypothetical protein
MTNVNQFLGSGTWAYRSFLNDPILSKDIYLTVLIKYQESASEKK